MVKRFINKIVEWYKGLDALLQAMLQGFFFGVGCMATIILLAAIFLGCTPEPSKKADPFTEQFRADYARMKEEALEQRTRIGPVILEPGQTAMLLEPVQALARIPYQGGQLYEGPVMFQTGSMVVKPKEE